jgi:hypothetical protein
MSLNQRATAEFSTYVHQVLLKPATYPSKHVVQVNTRTSIVTIRRVYVFRHSAAFSGLPHAMYIWTIHSWALSR